MRDMLQMSVPTWRGRGKGNGGRMVSLEGVVGGWVDVGPD